MDWEDWIGKLGGETLIRLMHATEARKALAKIGLSDIGSNATDACHKSAHVTLRGAILASGIFHKAERDQRPFSEINASSSCRKAAARSLPDDSDALEKECMEAMSVLDL